MTEDSQAKADAEAKDRSPVPWPKLLLPVFAFILMLLWSNIPPYRAHIKNEKRDWFVWHWRLYQQGGLKACEVRYFDMNKDGEVIKRWELLGYERPGQMPDQIGRVQIASLEQDHLRVCQALRKAGDPEPNVQALTRCGVKMGWKVFDKRKRNVCEPKKKNKKRPPKKTNMEVSR